MTIVVEPARADDIDRIGAVYVDTWRATYQGILAPHLLAQMRAERIAEGVRRQMRKGDVVLVARDGDLIEGFATGGRESERDPFFRSEIYTLYVHPQAQRGGVGSGLVVEMLRRLPGPIFVWVLARNEGACAFYEAVGAVPVRRAREDVGGVSVLKIGYAWFDTD